MAELSSLQFITRAVYNSSGANVSYAVLNGSGFSDDIKILKIYNGSDVGFDISYDGSTDHDYYPPGATLIIDIQANHADQSAYGSGMLNGMKGQKIWGKNSAGTGNLYIIGYR